MGLTPLLDGVPRRMLKAVGASHGVGASSARHRARTGRVGVSRSLHGRGRLALLGIAFALESASFLAEAPGVVVLRRRLRAGRPGKAGAYTLGRPLGLAAAASHACCRAARLTSFAYSVVRRL